MTKVERESIEPVKVDPGEAKERFEKLGFKISQKKSLPTTEELEEYFEAAKAVPPIDFDSMYAQEKRENSDRYRAVVKEAKRLVGIKEGKS